MPERLTFTDYTVAALLFAFGLFVGSAFPDWDYKVPFLVHRSLLTHGALVPFLLFAVLRKAAHPAPRYLAIGFCLATAVHLAFDLFPRRWWGYAKVWAPLYGRTGELFSWMWIALGILAGVYFECAPVEWTRRKGPNSNREQL